MLDFLTIFFTVFLLVVVGNVISIPYRKRAFRRDVEKHSQNLRKGGLIPRAETEVHDESLKQIYEASPNIQLPKARFCEPPSKYWKWS